MRQLFPDLVDPADPLPLYEADHRPAPPGRPWLLTNMIASTDGAVAVGGRSRGLGTPADKAVFSALRSVADVVLAGAGTVRAERYGPPRSTKAIQQRRTARGQAPFPRLAVVSARLDLDFDAALFTATPSRPFVVTTHDAPADRRVLAEKVADVIEAGNEILDLTTALAELSDRGVGIVTCEGGPQLNGSLFSAGLLDELCLSLAPTLVGGDSARAVLRGIETVQPLQLRRVLEDDGMLFLRYTRTGD